MARLDDLDVTVLVRQTTATTYHFGLVTPICEKEPSDRDTQPELVYVADAVREKKRLCNRCAALVSDWTRTALVVAGETDLRHPSR